MGLAADPHIAHIGQAFEEPEGRKPEGAGEAAHLAAAFRAEHSGPGFRNEVRSDPVEAKGATSPAIPMPMR